MFKLFFGKFTDQKANYKWRSYQAERPLATNQLFLAMRKFPTGFSSQIFFKRPKIQNVSHDVVRYKTRFHKVLAGELGTPILIGSPCEKLLLKSIVIYHTYRNDPSKGHRYIKHTNSNAPGGH